MHFQALALLILTTLSGVIQFYFLDGTEVILFIILTTVLGVWLISIAVRNTGIIDVFWGILFIAGAYSATILSHNQLVLPNLILLAMIAIWAIRLSLHLFIRSLGKPEDARYAQWRKEGGNLFWIRSLFTIFLLQAWIAWAILAPVNKQLLTNTDTQLTTLALCAMGLWVFGFCYQSIADYQLFKFKQDSNNEGKLLTSGLWQYSRHPNYFAEIVMWWAIYLFTVSYGGTLYLIGPIIITHTLIKFSGAPMLDALFKKTKPGFDDYQKTVPELIPSWLFNRN